MHVYAIGQNVNMHTCVLAAVGVSVRVFMSVFMCVGRDCKFTEGNVDVCRPHISPENPIKMCLQISEKQSVRLLASLNCMFSV